MDSITVYIGLGSNLSEPVNQVHRAYQALGDIAGTTAIQLSPLYCSKAIGPANQPDYVNAVAQLATALSPIQLLEALQAVELQQQRVRVERWGPRTIDLDILLYGKAEIRTPRLTVPHAELKRRNFVLKPLLDLDAQLHLPDGTSVAAIHTHIGMAGLTLLDQPSLGNRS